MTSNLCFNPLSSFTKREISIKIPTCHFIFCFNPLSSFTKREISNSELVNTNNMMFQSTLFIYEERNFCIPVFHIVTRCFNPLSSFTKREIIGTPREVYTPPVSIHSLHLRREKCWTICRSIPIALFQSTLFIYEERNKFLLTGIITSKKFQSTLFIYEERNL